MIAITSTLPILKHFFIIQDFSCQTWKREHIQEQSNPDICHYESIQIHAMTIFYVIATIQTPILSELPLT